MHPLVRARLKRERIAVVRMERKLLAPFERALSAARNERSMLAAIKRFADALEVFTREVAADEWHASAAYHLKQLGERDVSVVALAVRGGKKRLNRSQALKRLEQHSAEINAGAVSTLTDQTRNMRVRPIGNARAAVRELRGRARSVGKRAVVTVMGDADTLGALSVAHHVHRHKQVSVMKEWVTDGSNVCDDCDELDGEQIDFMDDFDDGDPPKHPNCGCVLVLQKGD